MRITLAKALKLRKRTIERINQLDETISINNSVINGNQRDIDVWTALDERADLVTRLIEIKLAISDASREIAPKILRVSEIKGLIVKLKALDTKNGKQISGYSDVATEYIVAMTASDVAKKVLSLEKSIDDMQEEIDAFNYRVNVILFDIES